MVVDFPLPAPRRELFFFPFFSGAPTPRLGFLTGVWKVPVPGRQGTFGLVFFFLSTPPLSPQEPVLCLPKPTERFPFSSGDFFSPLSAPLAVYKRAFFHRIMKNKLVPVPVPLQPPFLAWYGLPLGHVSGPISVCFFFLHPVLSCGPPVRCLPDAS